MTMFVVNIICFEFREVLRKKNYNITYLYKLILILYMCFEVMRFFEFKTDNIYIIRYDYLLC